MRLSFIALIFSAALALSAAGGCSIRTGAAWGDGFGGDDPGSDDPCSSMCNRLLESQAISPVGVGACQERCGSRQDGAYDKTASGVRCVIQAACHALDDYGYTCPGAPLPSGGGTGGEGSTTSSQASTTSTHASTSSTGGS